jgi:hypothetical protein
VPATQYNATGRRRPDFMNWHRVDEHFDFDAPSTCQLSSRDLCNALIDSFQFMFNLDPEHKIYGFMISPDRERTLHLYELRLAQMIKWTRYVASDDVVSLGMKRDKRGDLQITEAERGGPIC